MTHEPKLARAKRLIPEWTVYDDEVAALAARIASTQQDTVNAFTGRADELGQAQQQKAERDEFVEAQDSSAAEGGAIRTKDEL